VFCPRGIGQVAERYERTSWFRATTHSESAISQSPDFVEKKFEFYLEDTAMYFVYILECKDKSLHVGSANNLKRRLHAHNYLKSGAHYTKIRRPVILKYSKKYKTDAEARKRERELKALTRAKKLKLIK